MSLSKETSKVEDKDAAAAAEEKGEDVDRVGGDAALFDLENDELDLDAWKDALGIGEGGEKVQGSDFAMSCMTCEMLSRGELSSLL
jgi:hypothetical protein